MLERKDILLEKYQIEQLIASGGMGNVWLADDLILNKKWAVKEILKASKEYQASVNNDGTLTEVEILTMLDNPYAPRIVDRFENEEIIAVVMDYIEGQNLLQLLKAEGPQSEAKVVEWATCICDLLSFLHHLPAPVIYNDIKPENIILKSGGGIKVIDYGIAKMPTRYPNKTPIGTPGYASPEHYKGDTDCRSDIYSLGVTMYQLLTGDNPCVKGFVLKPLSAFSPHANKKLQKILTIATQKDPKKRFQTADDFKDALQEYMREQLLPQNTKTTILEGEEIPQEEDPPVPSQKETPAANLEVKKSVSLFNAICDKLSSLVRFLALIVIAVLLSIGITTLIEPTLRNIFFELLRNLWDLLTL